MSIAALRVGARLDRPRRALIRRWGRREAAQFAALHEFATLLAGERDLAPLLAALVAGLAERFGYRYVSVFLLADTRLLLQAQRGYVTPITTLALGEGITGLVARDGQPRLVRDGQAHPNYLYAEDHFGSQASVPLARAGQVLGVLNLEGGIGELRAADLRLLTILAAPVAVAIENAHLVARLTAQATRDPLTGLLNRRGILAALDDALACATPDTPVAVLLADLNGFKAVNDRHGHAVGDHLLVALADLLVANVRPGDQVGRLGGDEFLVVLLCGDAAQAGTVVRRLATALAAEALPPGLGYSLGLATATAPEEAAVLLARADRAMYAAKRHGDGAVRFLHPEGYGQQEAVPPHATENPAIGDPAAEVRDIPR